MIAKASSWQSHEEEILVSGQEEMLVTTKVTFPQIASRYAGPKMENLDEVQIDPNFPNRVMFIGDHLVSLLHDQIYIGS